MSGGAMPSVGGPGTGAVPVLLRGDAMLFTPLSTFQLGTIS
jgi:hypothetical protein